MTLQKVSSSSIWSWWRKIQMKYKTFLFKMTKKRLSFHFSPMVVTAVNEKKTEL